MSFRRRMVLLAAAAVAVAVVLVSVVVYFTTRDELLGQIDTSLQQKLTPGESQSVQVRIAGGAPAFLAKLRREGKKLPPSTTLSLSQIRDGAIPKGAKVVEMGRVAGGKPVLGGKWIAHSTSVHGSSAPGPGDVGFAKLVLPDGGLGTAAGYAQLIQGDGHVLRTAGKGLLLPITAATRASPPASAAPSSPTRPSPGPSCGSSPSPLRRTASGRWRCRSPKSKARSPTFGWCW